MTQDYAAEKQGPSADCDRIVASLTKPVVLVGMMGTGKSRLANALGAALNLPVCDSDQEVERAAGQSVAEYIEKYGEDAFRDGEQKVIARLIQDGTAKIIATGGGAVKREATRLLLKQQAITVWLTAEIPVLVARVGDGGKRPLLKGHDPAIRLKQLLDERAPLYTEVAAFTVDSSHERIEDTCAIFLQALKNYLDGQKS